MADADAVTATPTAAATLPDLLTTVEAANYLRVKPQSLALWRVQKRGPAYLKIGGRKVLYERVELERFKAECRVTPGAAA